MLSNNGLCLHTAVQYVLLFLQILPGFESYVVTRSYSSRPFYVLLVKRIAVLNSMVGVAVTPTLPMKVCISMAKSCCMEACMYGESIGYGPFHVGVASRLATAMYVAMVTPILYDN